MSTVKKSSELLFERLGTHFLGGKEQRHFYTDDVT